ncbi:MAG: excinuclease ABC subunit C, partial [Acidobacteria bacterium]|nr:excinuclease ABC subunit C [Acidobacteriota bacterium]
HRQRRSSSRVRSSLLDIPGVGEKTARKLLRHFGSLQRVKEASLDELAEVAPFPLAQRIHEKLGAPASSDAPV